MMKEHAGAHHDWTCCLPLLAMPVRMMPYGARVVLLYCVPGGRACGVQCCKQDCAQCSKACTLFAIVAGLR
eukprot:1668224-Alexandrium_andersonii.AAC.1